LFGDQESLDEREYDISRAYRRASYEEVLRALGLMDRTDPITELIAKKISKSVRVAWARRLRLPQLLPRNFGSKGPLQAGLHPSPPIICSALHYNESEEARERNAHQYDADREQDERDIFHDD
jgi:hypothetical protein